MKTFVLNRNIDWKVNVPTASWWGGFFEICVKLVKRCLKKVLGNAKLSYEELESVLIETEEVLNSRPLTYVYDELTAAPLTPSRLVIGHPLQESMEERISDWDPWIPETQGRRTEKIHSSRRHCTHLRGQDVQTTVEFGESRETIAGTRQSRACSGSGDSGQFSPQDSSETSNSEAVSS